MPHVDVVTHVHWDREWYRTFDGFRSRLVELVDSVLDQLESGTLDNFLLDGQTSIVEDYLEVRPDSLGRIRAQVIAGRLRVGPWYVLADKTLVSGESLIRNLLVGTTQARSWGGVTEVGYCPDMFGHPPELPSVLVGFGIERALVWRGADPTLPVFRWRAPDGSSVLTLRNRYYEPEILWEADGADERFASWLAARRDELPNGPWLLLNGGDHLAPRDLSGTLDGLDAPVPTRPSTLEAHLDAFTGSDQPQVEGPLRRPGVAGAFLLAGTLSIRPRQKRLHADVQALLETVAEPLVARACAAPTRYPGVGFDEPSGAANERPTRASLRALLDLAWRHVLQGQPHDSVCGCGTDQVAADTFRRYEAAHEVATQVVARALRRLGLPTGHAPSADADELFVAVMNPSAVHRSEEVVAQLRVPADRRIVEVLGVDGRSLPFEVVAEDPREHLDTDIATLPTWPRTRATRLRVGATAVPAGGWSTLRCRLAAHGDDAATGGARPGDDDLTIAAGSLLVGCAEDGTLTVTDTRTGRTLAGVARFVDTGDRGDTYNHDEPIEDRTVVPRLGRVRRVESPVASELHVELEAALPIGLAEDRDTRAAGTTPLRARVVARLVGPDPQQLELHMSLDTDARDHRLRLHVPAGVVTDTFATDSAFTWQQHPVPERTLVERQTQPGMESDPLTQPAHGLVATGRGRESTALLVHGTPEVAAVATRSGTELAVTLLRSVGQLGRHDLRSRTMGAGPPVPTPAAQEPGAHNVRLALVLGRDEAQLTRLARAWRSPLHAVALSGAPAHPEVEGPVVEGAQLSAWKPARDGEGWVVRVVNPTSTPSGTAVTFPWPARVQPCRLDESPIGEPPVALAAGEPFLRSVAAGGTSSLRVEVS